MPFGDGQPQEINAGIAAQPLVTSPDRSITDQDAVAKMADAFRQGFITTQDIMQNVGMTGPRKKAELQQLSEYVNPEMIQARLNTAGAQGAQANLAKSQALAEMPLVGQAAELKSKQIEQEKAGIWQKEALAAYQARGYRPIYKPDGSIDSEKMAVVGRSLVDANVKMGYAQSMLAGKWTQEPRSDGLMHNVLRNTLGEDVTPHDKNPTVKYYHKMMQDARKTLFSPLKEPDDIHVGRPDPEENGGASAPAVTPTNPSLDILRNNINSAAVPPSTVVGRYVPLQEGMPAPNIANSSATVQPKETTVSTGGVTVTTKEGGTPAEYNTGTGFTTPLPGYFGKPEEISSALSAHPAVRQWNESKGAIENFRNNITAPVSATTDTLLAASVAQLVEPASSGVTFDFKKLINDKPILEEIERVWSKAKGESAMSPQARQRLIDAGERIIAAKAAAARPQLQLAQDRWSKLPDSVKANSPILDAYDEQALGGSPVSPTAQSPGLPPGAVLGTQGGRRGYLYNGQFYAYK